MNITVLGAQNGHVFFKIYPTFFAELQKIPADLASLDATALAEARRSSLVSWLSEVGRRVEWLKDADKRMKVSLEATCVATRLDVHDLRGQLETTTGAIISVLWAFQKPYTELDNTS